MVGPSIRACIILVSLHAGSSSLCTHSVVINDLGNDGELSGEGTVVDENDSADFDESLEGGRSLNLNGSEGPSQSSEVA